MGSKPFIHRVPQVIGYMLQYDTTKCINSIEPSFGNNTYDGVFAKITDGAPKRFYETFERMWTVPDEQLNFISKSDGTPSATYSAGTEVKLTNNVTLMPVFSEGTPSTTVVGVCVWVDEGSVDSSIYESRNVVIIKYRDTPLFVNDTGENTYSFKHVPTSATGSALCKVFEKSGNRYKVGVWVKAETWIYDEYWKPAPSAIGGIGQEWQKSI